MNRKEFIASLIGVPLAVKGWLSSKPTEEKIPHIKTSAKDLEYERWYTLDASTGEYHVDLTKMNPEYLAPGDTVNIGGLVFEKSDRPTGEPIFSTFFVPVKKTIHVRYDSSWNVKHYDVDIMTL